MQARWNAVWNAAWNAYCSYQRASGCGSQKSQVVSTNTKTQPCSLIRQWNLHCRSQLVFSVVTYQLGGSKMGQLTLSPGNPFPRLQIPISEVTVPMCHSAVIELSRAWFYNKENFRFYSWILERKKNCHIAHISHLRGRKHPFKCSLGIKGETPIKVKGKK